VTCSRPDLKHSQSLWNEEPQVAQILFVEKCCTRTILRPLSGRLFGIVENGRLPIGRHLHMTGYSRLGQANEPRCGTVAASGELSPPIPPRTKFHCDFYFRSCAMGPR